MSFTVDTEKLSLSATAVTGHGENLAVNHTTTDARFTGAEGGWRGKSAAALTNRLATWTTNSATLLTNIGGHANDMHTSVFAYNTNEEQSAQALAQVYTHAPAPSGAVDL